MRLTLPIVATVALLPPLLGKPAPASRTAGVTFSEAALTVGARFEVTAAHTMKMSQSARVGGQEVQKTPWLSVSTAACTVTIDGAEATCATAATLVFGACSEVAPDPVAPAAPEPRAVSGKTFAAKRGEERFVVTGKEVDVAGDDKLEIDMLVDHLLGSAPLAEVLAGKTLKKGDRVEVPLELAQACFTFFSGDADVTAFTPTLAQEPGAGTEAIVFDATAKMQLGAIGEGPVPITMEPADTWTIARSTCRLVGMAMKGPTTMNGSIDEGGMKMEMKGSGEWKLDWSVAAK
ncbi:MAG: hypothetical protein EXR73_01130 [Myxococcales bacterium]|nr:hypothetical protein [Myxococcales bacterium]